MNEIYIKCVGKFKNISKIYIEMYRNKCKIYKTYVVICVKCIGLCRNMYKLSGNMWTSV